MDEARALAGRLRALAEDYAEPDTNDGRDYRPDPRAGDLLAAADILDRLAAPEVPMERDTLGRMVREAWVRWAKTQPNPKPTWLAPYDDLSEADKEADRQIGEAIAKWTMIGVSARANSPALSPPEGVGLTRYDLWVDTLAGEIKGDEKPEGEWVLYEDAAAALLSERQRGETAVGLTRWDWEYNGMSEDATGLFVRHEDAAAALAAEKARGEAEAELRATAWARVEAAEAQRDTLKTALEGANKDIGVVLSNIAAGTSQGGLIFALNRTRDSIRAALASIQTPGDTP